ncbi:CPBP family intramembrane glutamic endopeptidase [Massilia sp. METH4]|uniref:CPBP family intramembrane glutamic endopeptidase n=1 Tax=Massilia sp. METH4 TaxID=3123041 RepID=UPI0030CBB755
MNGASHIGTARAGWLLARLRLRRLLNMATLSMWRKRATGRAATAGKRRGRWLVPLVMGLLMTLAFSHMAHQVVVNLHCELTPHNACAGQASPDARLDAAAGELRDGPFSPPLLRGLAMQLWLLWLVALLVPLGSRELAQPDWDLEWLVTLPVARTGLLWARVLERTVANPTGWLVLWPAALMTGWHAGLRWSAPLAATAAALALLALAAVVRTLADTGLRLSMPPSQLRNLQAAISVAAMPLIYLVIALSTGRGGITMDWARAWPAWTLWTPPGLVAQWLDARSMPAALGLAALLALQVALLLWAGIALLARQLAAGVVAASSRETARTHRPPAAALKELPGTALQRRELRLLGRDRTFLVQSLVVPLVIIGSQMFFTGRIDAMAQLGTDQALLASIAFGLGSYVLLLSAFQTINTEGQALWLLYTFPGTLERMLLEKARLWAVLALVYPAAVFAIGIGFAPQVDEHLLARIVLVALGIPVFALIAVALGVWASDPLAQEAAARIRPTYVYLYSILAALYGFALYTDTWAHRVAVVVLLAALALALWQKARDHLPYLLDPAATPPPRVSAADGMVAALLFFAAQAIALAIIHEGEKPPALAELALALAIGGAIVWALARFVYWRMRTSGVPRLRQGPALPAVLAGAAWALPAIAAGVLWLMAMRHFGIALPRPEGAIALPLLLALACVAAPLSEEFIFRGLLFGGLRRSLAAAPAIAVSAALFAVVHPPLSMMPVFVLGLCTACAYARNGSLLAPVITHAVYNGAMVMIQA